MSRLLRPAPIPADARSKMSVVIPCYNYENYVGQAIASALDQPGLDLEVVVVDDASADGSAALVASMAAADPRIRLIEHPVNRGHITTYNDGLNAATGTYVALLSADDVLAPAALTRAVALFVAEPSVGLVYGHPVRFNGDDRPACRADPTSWRVWDGPEWAAAVYSTGRNALLSPEAVLRVDVQREIGGYDPDQPHAGDLAMWLRAASVADVGHLAGVDQACYREHSDNMHSVVFGADQARGMMIDLESRLLAFKVNAQRFTDGERMFDTACRALAVEALDLASRAYVWNMRWPTEELAEFARTTYGEVASLPEWRILRRRMRAGTRWAGRNPAFVLREKRTRRKLAAEDELWAIHGLRTVRE